MTKYVIGTKKNNYAFSEELTTIDFPFSCDELFNNKLIQISKENAKEFCHTLFNKKFGL